VSQVPFNGVGGRWAATREKGAFKAMFCCLDEHIPCGFHASARASVLLKDRLVQQVPRVQLTARGACGAAQQTPCLEADCIYVVACG